MLDQLEVERALDWRKGAAARERKARWRGEGKLATQAASATLARVCAHRSQGVATQRELRKAPHIRQGELF